MTPREQELLAFIASHIAKYSHSPSYKAMADHLGLRSKSGPYRFVDNLIEQRHLIKTNQRGWGNLRLVNPLENFSTEALVSEIVRRREKLLR